MSKSFFFFSFFSLFVLFFLSLERIGGRFDRMNVWKVWSRMCALTSLDWVLFGCVCVGLRLGRLYPVVDRNFMSRGGVGSKCV